MFREQQTRHTTSPHDLPPEVPVADYEEPTLKRHSVRKKLGASVLAAATLFTPSAQYGTAHEQSPRTETDTSSSEVCHDNTTTIPAINNSETFVLTDAYNDPLSETGERTTLAQFEQSSTLQDIQEYVQSYSEVANITTIEVNGTASDDNRSNVEAGIGQADEINQRTATSYANIATRAIKKMLGGVHEAQFSQSAEERLLSIEQQHLFEATRQNTGMPSSADLLTAYNDATSTLDEESRRTLDSLIGQHRGVEITVHTATPEQTIVTTECEPTTGLPVITPTITEQPGTPLPPYDPMAILPTWSRVTRQASLTNKKASHVPHRKTFVDRVKWHAETASDNLKYDWHEFKDTMTFVGHGIASTSRNMSSEITGSLRDTYTTRTANEASRQRKLHTSDYHPANHQPAPKTRRERLLQPISGQLEELLIRQQKLNRIAQIPTSDLDRLDPQSFHDKHGVFRDECHEVRGKYRSLPLRRMALRLSTSSKK